MAFGPGAHTHTSSGLQATAGVTSSRRSAAYDLEVLVQYQQQLHLHHQHLHPWAKPSPGVDVVVGEVVVEE